VVKRKWVFRGIASAVVAIVAFWVVFISQVPRFSNSRLSEVWNASNGEPMPPRAFYAVAYPRFQHVELRNDQGESCGRLERAILVSIDEWERAEPISVFVDAATRCTVAHDDVVLQLPDVDAACGLVRAANEFFSSSVNPNQHGIKEFSHQWSDLDGMHGSTVYLASGDVLSCKYRVVDGSLQPERILRYNPKLARFEWLAATLASAPAAALAFLAYWMMVSARVWWFRPRPPRAAA
jgi:hypothetical protein